MQNVWNRNFVLVSNESQKLPRVVHPVSWQAEASGGMLQGYAIFKVVPPFELPPPDRHIEVKMGNREFDFSSLL